MSTLDSVLNSDEGEPEIIEPQQAAPEPEATGEVEVAPPATVQEDPIDTHRKGLEAATVAERSRRQAAEARAQALEAQLQHFMAQQQPRQAEEGAPDPAKYQDNPQEYWRLLARYEARQELKETLGKVEQQRADQARMRQEQELETRVNSVIVAGKAKYADFDAVINSGLGPYLTPALREVLAADGGHEVAYWLGKNPAEALRVSQLSPAQMGREIGRIESRMTATAQAAKPAPIPQTLTQARDSRGQFQPAYAGPTPLDSILSSRNT